MFAPRSQHIPRTYSVYQQPTTSKKNLNKENANANAFPSKTPSRAGKGAALGGLGMGPGTGMRMGLGVKTEGRDRNVLGGQVGAGKGKGKADGSEIEPKRLFASTSTKSTIPPSKSLSSMPTIPSGKPAANAHKTPAPQRRTYQALRTPAPALLPDPAPTPLPSATRTRRRSRQSLSNISLTPIKAQIESHFVTPAPVAWEEELSLGSIEEVGHEVLQGVQEETEEYIEPEYMPPPVEELPWTPAWEHPDLGQIFTTLTAMPPMWTINDEPTIRDIPPFEAISEELSSLTLTGDDELEEAWLRPKVVENQAMQPSKPRVTFGGVIAQPPIAGRTLARSTAPGVAKPSTSAARSTAKPASSLKVSIATRAAASTPASRSNDTARTAASRPLATGRATSRPPVPVPRQPVVRGGAPLGQVQKGRPAMKVDPKDIELISSWGSDDVLGDDLILDLGLDASSRSSEGTSRELESGLGALRLSDRG
ncbi:hypothetical protein I317_03783 [Kwoniella heveanensis CBS 569]|nr:hypothetical protein I317_03783 [Kwoniella heveanensis CBS 569]